MVKKIDGYILKTFFGPFLFIFSVLFFIFMVQFAWQEMDKFAGKGLDTFTIFKLLFYGGLSLIQLILPLTILLSAIMTFGGFGERYELAAMKSTGISLARIMMPVFVFIFGLSVGLFFFSDTVVPESQKKAKNMLYNVASTKPALNFEAGVFLDGIPGFSMKFGNKYGEDGQFLEDVFIHKSVSSNENQQTIVARSGVIEPAPDRRFLKLVLFNGNIYEDEVKGKNRNQRRRQPNRSVKFDTLTQYFDISILVDKAIEEETVSDYYKFMNTRELANRIDTLSIQDSARFERIYKENYTALVYGNVDLDSMQIDQASFSLPFVFEKLSPSKQQQIITNSIQKIEQDILKYKPRKEEVLHKIKSYAKHVLHINRNFSNALMCIAFFLIGAPLGAIIRKGGIGMPVVVAIGIFISFYLVYMYSENLAKNGIMEPFWAAWLPCFIFLPLGGFFTYKAMTDSALFDLSGYLAPIQKLFSKFGKNKTPEHSRYQ